MKLLLRFTLFFGAGTLLIHPEGTAQIKIGDNPAHIDSAAVLELESSSKALLLTRLPLASTSDITTVPDPKAGMIVYNTNPAITSGSAAYTARGAGLYCYDGTGWRYAGDIPAQANNGLTRSADSIQLGGTLTRPTTIDGGTNSLDITGAIPATGAAVLRVTNAAGTVADGADLFAASNTISGSNGSVAGDPGTLRALYNNALTASDNVRVQGSLNEASTSGAGLGADNTPQATGATGLADYTGTADAPVTDYLVGLRGAAYTSGNRTNGLNIVGENFGGSYYRSVGGYFYPNGGSDANLGVVAQIGGTENAGWRDTGLAGKHIAVAAINYDTGSSNLAFYANGGVQLANLAPGLATDSLITMDPATNNLRRLDPNRVLAGISAGNGLTKTGNDIRLGGTLTGPTNIMADSNAFYFSGNNNKGDAEGVLNVENNVTNPSSEQTAIQSTISVATGSSTGFIGDLVGVAAEATTNSDDYQSIGGQLVATTTSTGANTGNSIHAIGGAGIAYAITPNAAAPDAVVIGLSGGTSLGAGFGSSGSTWNAIGTEGYINLGGTTAGHAAGGYFDGNGTESTGTGFGLVGMMGGTLYQTLYDTALNGYHIGMAAVNYTPTPTGKDLALYTEGNVKMNGAVSVHAAIPAVIGTSYDIQPNDYLVVFDGSNAVTSITLPPAGDLPGRILYIKNYSGTTAGISNYITETGATGNMAADGTVLHLISDGTNWQQVQ